MLKSYGWECGGGHVVICRRPCGGGPCDYCVSPSPFGLDFGTLDFRLGLDNILGYFSEYLSLSIFCIAKEFPV